MPARWIRLDGARNFRDLGGYEAQGGTVAWGRVFRSDRLTDLTASDAAALQGRGLRTVIDLRTAAEAGRYGPGVLDGRVTRLHQSLLTPTLVLRPALDYADWAGAAAAPLTAIFSTMAGPVDPFPLVFHCSVGKDRTGIVAALLLSVLGCSSQQIIDDYALTRKAFPPGGPQIGAWRRRVLRHFPGIPAERSRQLLDADPATMDRFLQRIAQRHGSVRQFLLGIGVNAEQQGRIRARLIQPTDARSP